MEQAIFVPVQLTSLEPIVKLQLFPACQILAQMDSVTMMELHTHALVLLASPAPTVMLLMHAAAVPVNLELVPELVHLISVPVMQDGQALIVIKISMNAHLALA